MEGLYTKRYSVKINASLSRLNLGPTEEEPSGMKVKSIEDT